ncbi:MAG: molybdopterin-dependent oxidoreductase, partial [Advenella sp.]
MSHVIDRLKYFSRKKNEFSGGHGNLVSEDRSWEQAYRDRWQHDKIVRSTHGVNCTGSCSWKIYVKGGIVTWETQQTDYPRTRADMPNHEPRGCSRGASYSWYLYSANRIKYPMLRGRLARMWREARKTMSPLQAWEYICTNPQLADEYKKIRGKGGFVRTTWNEANELIAAANAYTIKRYGPDRIVGFSPIPAMSMVSFAAGSRYLSLLGGTILSFYDWYCDLPPSSPQTWGEQTDVSESADWFNSSFIVMWGSNVPQTRTPDAHFMVEARYRGAKIVSVFPDYAEGAKFGDIWLHPKQGTDAALALAMGHVILKEFHLQGKSEYFREYCRQYSDMPFLVRLVRQGDKYVPDRMLRASDFVDSLDQKNNPAWKTVAYDELTGKIVVPRGSIGFRWTGEYAQDQGKWNLEPCDDQGKPHCLRLSIVGEHDEIVPVAFPYFGSQVNDFFQGTDHDDVLLRNMAVSRISTTEGEVLVTTVYDLLMA